MPSYLYRLSFFLIALVSVSSFCFGQSELIINGSTTVYHVLLKQHEKELEKRLSFSITITPNGSGEGLRYLASGQCQLAMISGPLEEVIRELESTGHPKLNPGDFQAIPLGKSEAVFIVNKSNPVQRISKENLVKIARGDILNWKAIGGNDERIIFFTMRRGDGVRTTVQQELLDGGFFSKYASELKLQRTLRSLVAGIPEAIGTISRGSIGDEEVRVVESDITIEQPLYIVSKGPRTAQQEAFIDELKKIARESLTLGVNAR